jgi:hypothetical protein
VIVTEGTPVPLSVTVPLRTLFAVFASAVSVKVPFPLPLPLLNVSHERLSLAVQLILELTSTFRALPPETKFKVSGVAVKNAAAPDWDNVIVTEGTPVPLSVTVPLRTLFAVFASAVSVSVPLPLPLPVLSVSHERLSLAVQLILELTSTFRALPPETKFKVSGVAVKNAAAPDWDNVIVTEGTPVPLSVTVPLRIAVEGLASAVSVKVPFPLPLPLLNVSHERLSLAVQLILELTSTFRALPPETKFKVSGVAVKNAAAPD